MSKRHVYPEDSIAIISRFFTAVDVLGATGKLKEKEGYSRKQGINPANFRAQKMDDNKGHFQVGWLVPLSKDFHIPSEGLMPGYGEMFKIER